LIKDLDKHFVLWIKAENCTRCYLWNRICRNLHKRSYKCFESGELGEYELERLRKLIREIRGKFMISTTEVVKFLAKEYNLEIDQSLIFKYATKGLITKEKKEGQGKSKGVKTFWEDSAPYKVYCIKQLLKEHELTLKEISRYKNLIYNFNELELFKYFADLDIDEYRNSAKKYLIDLEDLTEEELKMAHLRIRIKLLTVIGAFACAEAGYEYKDGWANVNGKNTLILRNSIDNQDKVKEIHVKIL